MPVSTLFFKEMILAAQGQAQMIQYQCLDVSLLRITLFTKTTWPGSYRMAPWCLFGKGETSQLSVDWNLISDLALWTAGLFMWLPQDLSNPFLKGPVKDFLFSPCEKEMLCFSCYLMLSSSLFCVTKSCLNH